MLNNEYNLIINCVAASLGKNVSLPELGEVNYALFYKYSVSHSITPLVFDGAKKLGIELPEEVAARFIKNVRQYATQYILQDEQLQFLTYTFEKNGIKNMPLKGSILRKMYPRPELRTSSDIDILYDVDSDKKIGEIFLNNGYELGEVAAKDTSYVKRPFLNVEMHRTLMGDHPELEGDFADVWDRVKLVDGKRFSYEMTNEDFYVYMTSHAAKHYLMGGIGIRFVTDTWVFNKYVGDNLNRKEVNKRLDEMGVLTFDKNITLLAEYWFGNGDADNVVLSLGDFICDIDLLNLLSFHRGQGLLLTVSTIKSEDNTHVNGGFFVVENEIYDYITENSRGIEADVLSRIGEDGEIAFYTYCGKARSIYTKKDVYQINSSKI